MDNNLPKLVESPACASLNSSDVETAVESLSESLNMDPCLSRPTGERSVTHTKKILSATSDCRLSVETRKSRSDKINGRSNEFDSFGSVLPDRAQCKWLDGRDDL